ncbi:MAG: hypothetical protein CVU54_00270 [Deltaproteobacteria bacterium HGW-Deltaproteobacteria-12]|jgi:hypothetical protein|nr:MAG: hypothetical protein CVU54_00270 [Deltaproteobacteria bacterium HGW-Deltaproteobacteria-12]
MTRLPLILLFISLIAFPASAGDVKERYIRENRLLEEELTLVRKPYIYIVFNLKEKKAYIKARGIHLRELQINDYHCWGSPVSSNVYRLIKKSTFFKPGREMIKPGESKEKDNYKIEALELANMPSRYTLVLDGGARILIRPPTEGIISGTGNIFYTSMRFLIRPLSMLWYTLRGKPYTAVDIIMDQNDARAVYWSLSETSGVIIYPP